MHAISKSVMAIGLAAICAAGVNAQTQETKTTTKSKIEIKGGKDVAVTGCLERGANGDYMLTQIRDNHRLDPSRYALVTDEDLSKHVGKRVRIQGKTVANDKGKVSVETKTKTDVENGKDQETKTKVEGTGGAFDMSFLGVKSLKVLSPSCS
jgi:hypothetical protein